MSSRSIMGIKDDSGKLRYDLEPQYARRALMIALTIGSVKYGDENWRYLEDAADRYYGAAQRHLSAWRMGELLDGDGIPHLFGALASLAFIAELEFEPGYNDDNVMSEFLDDEHVAGYLATARAARQARDNKVKSHAARVEMGTGQVGQAGDGDQMVPKGPVERCDQDGAPLAHPSGHPTPPGKHWSPAPWVRDMGTDETVCQDATPPVSAGETVGLGQRDPSASNWELLVRRSNRIAEQIKAARDAPPTPDRQGPEERAPHDESCGACYSDWNIDFDDSIVDSG